MIPTADIRPGMVFERLISDTRVALELIIETRQLDNTGYIEFICMHISGCGYPAAPNVVFMTYKRQAHGNAFSGWIRTA